MCRRYGEKEDLEHILRRNFEQVPVPLSAMSTDQVEVSRFFREVYDLDLPRPIPHKQQQPTDKVSYRSACWCLKTGYASAWAYGKGWPWTP
jgi:hypothetical protein